LVELNPTNGREINKIRPCVVISPDEMNALSTVLVAPMTTKGFYLPCQLYDRTTNQYALMLPLPDASLTLFRLQYAPVYQPELGEKYPTIRAFKGYQLNNPLILPVMAFMPGEGQSRH
jgi:hypothetical protein